MIQRKADESIREFLLYDKRSLLVTGARQVGKTFSIRKVGKECFENFIEINFVEQTDAIELFENGKNAKELLLCLSAFAHKPLVSGKTLIFENLVAQELYVHGFAIEHSLFYFNSKMQGELDVVVEYDNQVLPIGVKSGKDYDRHNAIANVMGTASCRVGKTVSDNTGSCALISSPRVSGWCWCLATRCGQSSCRREGG